MHIISKEKHIGQVFTPDYLVCEMLDYVGYLNKSDILDKHIIDNSCGNGAFLLQITERYIQTAINNNLSKERIIKGLETFIHGIDNDSVAIENCIINLNNLVSNYGFENVNWDIRNDNTLKVKDYDGKMDFVVGNPPYVRVHNLENNYDEVKQFKFAEGGMTDLYLVFFEIGFNMLNHTGKLCYITPSSWLNSLAAKNLRSYIMQYRNLLALIDLEHFQPFDKITTYTLISLFSKSIEIEKIDYYTFNSNTLKREFIDELSYEDMEDLANYILTRDFNRC